MLFDFSGILSSLHSVKHKYSALFGIYLVVKTFNIYIPLVKCTYSLFHQNSKKFHKNRYSFIFLPLEVWAGNDYN